MSESRVLIIGDIHLSDRYTGRHIDYLANCFECLDMITEQLKEKKITHLFCLGDWVGIGLAEKNLRKRETLLAAMKVLQEWNTLTNGNVYSLRGNHDIGSSLTDYDLFLQLGLLKSRKQLDIGSTRFHFFDYGEEKRIVNIAEDKYNIGLFHENLLIEGLTTWYRGGVGVELSTLDNLYGISMAVAGHIHNPSPKMVSTSIKDSDITLFYPGCMTRPKFEQNLWTEAYAMYYKIDDMATIADVVKFQLKPIEETFTKVIDDKKDDENIDEATLPLFDIEALAEVLEELQYYNISGGQDYHSQITRVAGIDKVAADIALDYLQKVESEFKNKPKK